jgi:hypothetical protein
MPSPPSSLSPTAALLPRGVLHRGRRGCGRRPGLPPPAAPPQPPRRHGRPAGVGPRRHGRRAELPSVAMAGRPSSHRAIATSPWPDVEHASRQCFIAMTGGRSSPCVHRVARWSEPLHEITARWPPWTELLPPVVLPPPALSRWCCGCVALVLRQPVRARAVAETLADGAAACSPDGGDACSRADC